jgi:5-methyltetrahydropteroyltriglutamate--homocysteine methyltransferase
MSVITAQSIYRADHVGSFLRPAALRAAQTNPLTTPEQLAEAENQSVLECLARQQAAGVHIFSDGEFRRSTFMSAFNQAVEGIVDGDAVERQWSGTIVAKLGVAVAKVRQTRRMTKDEIAFLQAHSPGRFKITVPSANQFPAIVFKKGITDKVYASHSDLLWDCAHVIATEVKAIAGEGVSYIQLDAPRYSYFIDEKWRRYVREEMGMEPDAALREAIAVDNLAFNGVTGRPGLTTCIHLCRGNNRSQWYAEGGYEPLAEALFNELNVDAFSLEYDSPRAGGFEPLRHVPKGKVVVLGLVSSKVGELEAAETLIRRIDEAAKYVPIEQLTLSPQCGFASMAEGNLLSSDDQWRKLDLVVEVARRVWGTA